MTATARQSLFSKNLWLAYKTQRINVNIRNISFILNH